jgi:ribosome maturation factor RimP
MISKEQITQLATQAIGELDVYIADVLVKSENRIYVFLESDNRVMVEDCIIVSKFIESNLDREAEDFELNVSSYGVEQPLKFARQYIKNVGRTLSVKLNDDSELLGTIASATNEEVVVVVPAKKKKEEPQTHHINYNKINEARIVISFK